jgi:hypothetical protein
VAYNFFSISDKNPKGSLIASVTAPMAYVNSFSITPRYIILVRKRINMIFLFFFFTKVFLYRLFVLYSPILVA